NSYFAIAPWAGSTTLTALEHLEDVADAGTVAQPKTAFLNLGRFLQTAPLSASGGGSQLLIASMEGDTSFDPDSPVLFNGEAITGDALTTWNAIKEYIANIETRYIPQGGATLEELSKSNDLYQYARTLSSMVNELAMLFRLTGWL